MSEHQTQKPSRIGKEAEREKLAEIRMDESLRDDQVQRLTRKHAPWSDWILGEFLQYNYWLGVLAVDVFLIMDLVQRYHVRNATGLVLAIIGFMAAVYGEYLLFLRIWPANDLK
jgi:hypothetical protein